MAEDNVNLELNRASAAAGSGPAADHDPALARKLLTTMELIRRFEESVQYYFSLGMIHGTTHLGIGEEAAAAGTCTALDKEDEVFATHRGHGVVIAKGADISLMMAEIFGKATGLCKGHGGSMHFCDPGNGLMGTNGIVGPSAALACGAGLAFKKQGRKQIAAAFFGDGATNEGIFYEALNMASIWKLPVLFVCVDNEYGMSTHKSKVMADTDLSHRAIPFRIRTETIDGNDVTAVYEAVKRAKDSILRNSEPFMLVEKTYRISGHSKSDGNLYRTKEEIRRWKDRDPINMFKDRLLKEGVMTEEEIKAVGSGAKERIDEAVRFAIDSPYPSEEDITSDVYAR